MITFIKKLKTKEGINSCNLEKIKKEIPSEYEITNDKPTITYTSNHVVIAFDVKEVVIKKVAAEKKKAVAVVTKKKAAPAKA